MKKTILVFVSYLFVAFSYGQNKYKAEELVQEGISLHDRGDYNSAIAKYNLALKLDEYNLFALAEKALSLGSLGKYEESVENCQLAIENHPGHTELNTVYVTYGNALDAMKKTKESVKVYNEGILLFPDFYQLYFNKGVTLASNLEYDSALLCFQKSAMLNPEHAGSHEGIAYIVDLRHQKVPSVMSFCRFLVVEPTGERAKKNFELFYKTLNGLLLTSGNKSSVINIGPDFLNAVSDSIANENNFGSVELSMSFITSLNIKELNKGKNEAQKFGLYFSMMCGTLKEKIRDHEGFFWEYYAPYFIEMHDQKFIDTFSYIVFASSGNSSVNKWLKSHKKEVDAFYKWSESFDWATF